MLGKRCIDNVCFRWQVFLAWALAESRHKNLVYGCDIFKRYELSSVGMI